MFAMLKRMIVQDETGTKNCRSRLIRRIDTWWIPNTEGSEWTPGRIRSCAAAADPGKTGANRLDLQSEGVCPAGFLEIVGRSWFLEIADKPA